MQSEAPREERVQTKEKTHDEQSRAAPEEAVPEEIESRKAPPDMQIGRSLRTCLSRAVPTGTKPGQSQKRRATLLARRRAEPHKMRTQHSKAWGRPRTMQERRAIAADRSANDTAKQVTMTRETDISAEHAKEKWRAREKPILTESRPRCCKLPSRGASAPTAMLSIFVGGGQQRTTES